FFQAEDGIRDPLVTGVQTCALPILGGRMASMAVAEGMPAEGLVFLAYPLHPPGRPEKIRDARLDAIAVPMLFVQGTRDPFAQPEIGRASCRGGVGSRVVGGAL